MTRPKSVRLLVSCEHGGNRVPARYRRYFLRLRGPLQSHRGYDRGALQLARAVSRTLHAPLHFSVVTRMLVDLNRSVHHAKLHSASMAHAPEEVRKEVLERFYAPYRNGVESDIAAVVHRGQRALPVSCHSFTPRLNGSVRRAGLGLLFDPTRRGERTLCERWRDQLKAADAGLEVRFNYPYRGSADGLTTHLRRRFDADDYFGIEIEVNQKRIASRTWPQLRRLIVESLARALEPEIPGRRRAPSSVRAGKRRSSPKAPRRTSARGR